MGPIILAQASVLGRRHEKNGLDNQDRLFCCRLGTGCFDVIFGNLVKVSATLCNQNRGVANMYNVKKVLGCVY